MRRNTRHPHEALRRGRVPVRVALAVVAALLIGASVDAAAQIEFRGFQERHDRVLREFERTEQLWLEVRGRVARSNVPQVQTLVEQARTIQERAKEALVDAQTAGQTDGATAIRAADKHLQNCLSLTLRARDLTVRAARQLREDLSQEENARRTIDRVKDQLDRLEDADSRRVDQARQLLDRAEQQWRDGRFERALRLAQNAGAVLATLDGSADESGDSTQVAAALERARERLRRAEDAGADARRLQSIERLLNQAEAALDAGRPREAAQRILTARRSLDDLGQGGGDETSRTARALERLDAQIEQIQARFGDRLDESGQRLLRQAGQARDRAHRALDTGDEARAQGHIRAAADLLARLQRQAGGGRG